MGAKETTDDIYKIKYAKGGNEGSITYFPQQSESQYLALTPVMSKWYKTLDGAQKFMSTRGYKKA